MSNESAIRRLAVEGLVIVGSILLAFALDAWWDERSRVRELRTQVAVVADEMRATRGNLESVLEAHTRNAHLVRHLSDLLAAAPGPGEIVVSDTLVGPLLPQTTADVGTGSLDAFIAAGGLDLVADLEVRGLLLDWPTVIQDLIDDQVYLRGFAAADLASYLRANAAVANAERYSIDYIFDRAGVGPAVDPLRFGTVALRREQTLLNLLAARESGERALRNGVAEMIGQADRIISALEELD